MTDRDQDGVGDRCKNDIASAFAPTFRYNDGDDITHQSYWAANRVTGTTWIRVNYLIGYYFDLGVQGSNNYTACKLSSLSGILAECDGHHGDSEHVLLTMYYNSTTEHWVIQSIQLSHHGGYIRADRGNNAYPVGIAYNKPGRNPLVWVANGKHANYPSQAACDAGTGGGWLIDLIFSFDTCQGNDSYFSAVAGGNRNIGSAKVKLINCVSSEDPFYQNPPHPQECLWTASKFIGWQLDQTTWSEGYRYPLSKFGY